MNLFILLNAISFLQNTNHIIGSFFTILYLSGSSNSGHSINEFSSKEHIGVVEHSVFEGYNDELKYLNRFRLVIAIARSRIYYHRLVKVPENA